MLAIGHLVPTNGKPPKVVSDFAGERTSLIDAVKALEAENHLLREEMGQMPSRPQVIVDVSTIRSSMQKLQEQLSQGQKETA